MLNNVNFLPIQFFYFYHKKNKKNQTIIYAIFLFLEKKIYFRLFQKKKQTHTNFVCVCKNILGNF